MMAWYQSRDENYTSPIVRGMRRTKPSRRERILSDEEMRAVWRACDEINRTFGALIKVLLLTAQGREKVASMRWVDLKGGV
jgi:integrase